MNILFLVSLIASWVQYESKSFGGIYAFYLLIVWGSDYSCSVSAEGK